MANANQMWKAPTERQRIICNMAAALHKAECDEKPGEEYPSWSRLAEWAQWRYINRATKALNTIIRRYHLRQRG